MIICNENFETLSQRKYCDNEIKLMDETLGKNLNFTVLIFKDLNVEQINWVIHTGKLYNYLTGEAKITPS